MPNDEAPRDVERVLLVTDLCDMIAFHKLGPNPAGRLVKILRRAVNFIEGRECFPWEETS